MTALRRNTGIRAQMETTGVQKYLLIVQYPQRRMMALARFALLPLTISNSFPFALRMEA
jgi:hypothetical protein